VHSWESGPDTAVALTMATRWRAVKTSKRFVSVKALSDFRGEGTGRNPGGRPVDEPRSTPKGRLVPCGMGEASNRFGSLS
jgi:hypothetical protein